MCIRRTQKRKLFFSIIHEVVASILKKLANWMYQKNNEPGWDIVKKDAQWPVPAN